MRDAWLHRRLLKGGFPLTIPLFVLSNDAFAAGFEAMAKGPGAVSDYAPFPMPEFAVEFPTMAAKEFNGDPLIPERVLLVVTLVTTQSVRKYGADRIGFLVKHGLPIPDPDAPFLRAVDVFHDAKGAPGRIAHAASYLLMDDYTSFMPYQIDNVQMQKEFFGVDQALGQSVGALTPIAMQGDHEERKRFYLYVADECRYWLLAANAVIATPGLPREEGRSRAPEPKQRTRGAVAKPAEFAWSRISLDIDRTVGGGEKAQEAEARKLALHRVRAHLRFIKDKGLIPVRSHMRGNAANGVRIGRTLVHKGGQ